jgi:hypothetical protein
LSFEYRVNCMNASWPVISCVTDSLYYVVAQLQRPENNICLLLQSMYTLDTKKAHNGHAHCSWMYNDRESLSCFPVVKNTIVAR